MIDQAKFETLAAPPEVKAGLEKTCRALDATGVVTGLVLFGGLARGHYVPHESDVNLVVLVTDGAPTTISAIAEPLRAGYRSIRVEPLILTFDEVARSADVFPTKFQDIAAHHVVLAGTSPFASLQIPKEHLRLRVEQELRNASLRLRRRGVASWGRPEELDRLVRELLPGLSIDLRALLGILQRQEPSGDDLRALLLAVAEAVKAPHPGLELASLAPHLRSPEQSVSFFDGVLLLLEKAANAADASGGQ